MRALITGESGMLALGIKNAAAKLGIDVDWIDEWDELKEFKTFRSIYHNPTQLEFDITRPEIMSEVISRSKPDCVIHCGAIVNTIKCERDRCAAIETNILGSMNVANAAKANNVKRFVNISTTAIFNPHIYDGKIITEEMSIEPQTWYGQTKLAGELLVKKIIGLSLLNVRPVFIYGNCPADYSSMITRIIYNQLLNSSSGSKKILDVFLNPLIKKDYTRIEDFSEAFVLLLESDAAGDVIITKEKPRLFGEILKIISDLLGVDTLDISLHPEEDYLKNHVASAAKLHSLINWHPKYIEEEGIAMTVKSVRRAMNAKEYLVSE